MPPSETTDSAEAETLAFRAARVARLTSETGWLTLVGRHVLEPGDNQLPFGTVTLDAAGVVHLTVAPGVVATSRGRPLREETLRSDADGGPEPIEHAGLTYELGRRGELVSLRVRDPHSPRRKSFTGTDWYPFRPDWKRSATFEPYPEERPIAVPYDFGPVLSRSPGTLMVDLPGGPRRIDALMDDERTRLYVLFADETNRDETYQAGRFLYAPLPDPVSRRVVLDFNHALNPGCVFSEHAICPLPPPQNRFPLRVEAGEKRYRPPR